MIEYGCSAIQKDLLTVLLEIDRVCRQNDIDYSLHGGTLLGAVRNHHFIPWDDDADISMTRENFEKFKKSIKSDSEFKIDYVVWVPRFHNVKFNVNACVDIFIWDYISEKKIFQSIKLLMLRFMQGTIKNTQELKSSFKTHGFTGKTLGIITFIAGIPFTKKFKLRIYDYIGKNLFTGKKIFIHRSNDQYRGIKYIHDKDYMGEYINITFEKADLMANKRYREFLIREYGNNYLTPPPLELQVPPHKNRDALIKMNR